MGTGAITQYVDVAQLVLYLFWIFFAGPRLLPRAPRTIARATRWRPTASISRSIGGWPVPSAQDLQAVRRPRGQRAQPAARSARATPPSRATAYAGAPLVPVGDPMQAACGPGRLCPSAHDVPDHRLPRPPAHRAACAPWPPATTCRAKSTDPRGLPVRGRRWRSGRQGAVDLWVDHSRTSCRYFEVEVSLAHAVRASVLLPVTFARVHRDRVAVKSVLLGHQLAGVPGSRNQPDQVTLLEEEKICAYYGAGTLYAEPGTRGAAAVKVSKRTAGAVARARTRAGTRPARSAAGCRASSVLVARQRPTGVRWRGARLPCAQAGGLLRADAGAARLGVLARRRQCARRPACAVATLGAAGAAGPRP